MAADNFLGKIITGAFNNDYTFLETVGQGGYGTVYKVRSKKDYQTYAVKKIRFDQNKRKKKIHLIKRELINNAKLSHENVVRYYDSWVEESSDQTLSGLVSTESETETSKSDELASNKSINGHEKADSDSGEQASHTTEEEPDIIFDKGAPAVIQRVETEYISVDEKCDSQMASAEVQEITKFTEIMLNQIRSSVSYKKDSDSEPIRAEIPYSSENTEQSDLDLYIKMEFCEQTLQEVVDNGVLVDNKEKCWIFFKQIVTGLDYIHCKGIIHRDLNPRNMFVTFEDTVKIGDFGLSRLHGDDEELNININVSELRKKSQDGLTGNIGTRWYTAPEVLGKSSFSYGREVDLFSLGLIFFEMCHAPMKTEQEKAKIFEKLRNSRIFPESFDVKMNEKQTIIITQLLDPIPANRLPLRKLLDPGEGYMALEPLDKRNFKLMVAEVLSQPGSELYDNLIAQLFKQRPGTCMPSYDGYDSPKRVTRIKREFAAVAESRGASERNLPLFVPFWDKCVFKAEGFPVLDHHGNLMMFSDTSLRALAYDLSQTKVPPKNAIYSTPILAYQPELFRIFREERKPKIHSYIQTYASFLAKDDLSAVADALLILQEAMVKSGYKAEEFVLILFHSKLTDNLSKLLGFGDTEMSFLDKIRQVLLLWNTPGMEKSIPENGRQNDIQKISDEIRSMLVILQKFNMPSFNEDLAKHVLDVLDFFNNFKDILDEKGVCFEAQIGACPMETLEGAKEIGITFKLEPKQNSKTVVAGGQYESNLSDGRPIEFLWYEIDAFNF